MLEPEPAFSWRWRALSRARSSNISQRKYSKIDFVSVFSFSYYWLSTDWGGNRKVMKTNSRISRQSFKKGICKIRFVLLKESECPGKCRFFLFFFYTVLISHWWSFGTNENREWSRYTMGYDIIRRGQLDFFTWPPDYLPSFFLFLIMTLNNRILL